MKIRKSFVTNSSSASYVVSPRDHSLRDIARDMLDIMLEEDDDWWNEERIHPWKERLEKDLKGDSGIRFPSCNYDTHIWFDEYEGERKIIIHTCHNHPFDTIDYFQDIGYPEDGLGELYRKRNESQIFYDLAKDELIIGDEHYVDSPHCGCSDYISKFYVLAEKEAFEERLSSDEKLMWGNVICCSCGKPIKVKAIVKTYEDEDPEIEYRFVDYWDGKAKPKKKRRKRITTIDEDLMNALLGN